MKRILSVLLAAAVCLPMAAGCTQNTQEQGGAVTTITVWSPDSHSKDIYTSLIEEYNAGEGKEKGIEIVYEVKSGDYGQVLELAMASNQAPDLFAQSTTAGTMSFAANGQIAAFEDLPGGTEFLEKYQGNLQKWKHIYNGKTYAVPATSTTMGLIYNKDMFVEAGIVDENGEAKPPETLAEMRETAKLLTNREENKYGIIFPIKWGGGWVQSDVEFLSVVNSGHYGWDPVKGEFDYTKFIPAMETILGIKADESYYPGADSIDNDRARALFAEGMVGMKVGFSFDVGVLNDQFPAKCDWGVAPLPVANPSDRYKQRMAVDSQYIINAASVETVGGEKLMEAYKFLTSDELYRALYQECLYMPWNDTIIEGITPNADKKGWAEFASMISISATNPVTPNVDMAGESKLGDIFINEVWTGRTDPQTAVANYNTSINNALKRYYDAHPDETIEDYLDPDYNTRIEQ